MRQMLWLDDFYQWMITILSITIVFPI